LPPDLTIADAAAPRITLELALIAVLAGAAVLFPSLYYLMSVFKGKSFEDSDSLRHPPRRHSPRDEAEDRPEGTE
jgi:cytochrome bd-type quinol oxidase subunit 2